MVFDRECRRFWIRSRQGAVTPRHPGHQSSLRMEACNTERVTHCGHGTGRSTTPRFHTVTLYGLQQHPRLRQESDRKTGSGWLHAWIPKVTTESYLCAGVQTTTPVPVC